MRCGILFPWLRSLPWHIQGWSLEKKYYNLPIEKKSGHFVELASKIGIFTVLGWWQTPDLQVANWGPKHPKQGIHDQSHHPSIIDDGPLLWFHFGMVTTTALWIPRRIRVPNETCQKTTVVPSKTTQDCKTVPYKKRGKFKPWGKFHTIIIYQP